MKDILNLVDKNGNIVSFEIKSSWNFFTISKIKKLLKNGYVFDNEKDIKIAIKYKIYN